MNIKIYGIVPLIFLFVFGCADQFVDSTEEDAHVHEEDQSKEEVHLIQKQMDVMGIKLGKFQYLNLSTTVKSHGQLELPPQNKASLMALMGGRVRSIKVLEGDFVNKGQLLALLDNPEFIELQEDHMRAKSNLDLAEKNYERQKALHSDKASSEKVFQEAEAEYRSALAELTGSTAKLQIFSIDPSAVEKGKFFSSIPIYSPIKGFVRQIEINIGMFIHVEQEMFEIVDNEHIHIDLMVYEKDIDRVKNGQKVIFSISSNPDSIFSGSIFAVGKSFEKEPKAMLVHAEIDNFKGDLQSGLLPGMYVDARIITNEHNVRALPNDAIVNDGGLSYIFVLKPRSKSSDSLGNENSHDDEYLFRKIEVNTGASDIGFTEVVPAYNLPDHIRIVTIGAFYLLAEMKKGQGGHGHHH